VLTIGGRKELWLLAFESAAEHTHAHRVARSDHGLLGRMMMEPPQMAQGPPAASPAPAYALGPLSPDGMWVWNGYGWSPATRFASAVGRARVTMALLTVWALLAIGVIVALVGRIQLASDLLAGNSGGLTPSDVNNSDNLVASTALAEYAVYVLVAVAFLVWLHRAVTNSHGLGEQGLRFTPGWAVGWWFIPFANFVRPAQVMSETWRASDPQHARSDVRSRSQVSIAVVGLWWALFLLGGVIGRFAAFGSNASTLDGLRTNSEAAIGSTVLLIIAAGVLAWLMMSITQRQAVKAQALIQPNEAPPPPPAP
jgi:hypothetical protein